MKQDLKIIQDKHIELLRKISEDYKKDCSSIIYKLDQVISKFEQKIKRGRKTKK